MNRIIILFIGMFLTSTSCVQESAVKAFSWKIIATTPPSPGQQNALGFAGAVIGVQNDVLVVGGGANFPDTMPWKGGTKRYYNDLFLYVNGPETPILHKAVFKLPYPVAYAACVSTSHGILFAGGENEHGIIAKSSLALWDRETRRIRFRHLPDLPVAVTNAAATAFEDIVYLAGGETTLGTTDQFFSLDLNNIDAGWTTLPPIPKPVSHSVLLSQSSGDQNFLYLAGGRKKKKKGMSDFYASLFQFDPVTMQWNEKKPMPYNICAGTGIAINSHDLLFFGGDKGETFQKVETIIYAIESESNDSIRQKLIEKKTELQASHPGFSKEILLYNTVTDDWTSLGDIPFDVPVTTTAVKWGKGIVIPTGEVRAGVRTPQILMGIFQ